jgi:hypothetical protein
MTNLFDLDAKAFTAKIILWLNAVHPNLLPKTTVTLLTRAIKPHADLAMQLTHLREAIRLAELHRAKFEAAMAEDEAIEQLLREDEVIEAADRCRKLHNHPEVFFGPGVSGIAEEIEEFLTSLDELIATQDLEGLLNWETTYAKYVRQVEERTEQRAAMIDQLSGQAAMLRSQLRELACYVHPGKKERFEQFMASLDELLKSGSLEAIQSWIRDGKQRKLQYQTRIPRGRAA